MRYDNWDVILFPEGSKVPIQEFKTQCFVTKDHTSGTASSSLAYLQAHPYLHPSAFQSSAAGAANSPAAAYTATLGQTPCLTTFIPGLEPGAAFRVSVHNWVKPRPSRLLEGLMMRGEETVLFEVRVFVDGVCVSASLINETMWPHVVELSSFVDKNGDPEKLTFPPFHEELLYQTYWDAGETYGRIRVVLSEGFARPHRQPPFERVKDIVVFSFQHAPLHVLESSGIAWPNPGMWQLAQRQSFKYNLTPDVWAGKDEPDGHLHSPSRRDQRAELAAATAAAAPAPPDHPLPPWMWPRSAYPGTWNEKESIWTQPPPPIPTFQPPNSAIPVAADPFLDTTRDIARFPPPAPQLAATTTIRRAENISDVSMPDYPSFKGSRETSGQTGSSMKSVMYHQKEHSASQASVRVPVALDDPGYNTLIDAMRSKEASLSRKVAAKGRKPGHAEGKSKMDSTRTSSSAQSAGAVGPSAATAASLAPESTPHGVSSTSKSPSSSVAAIAGSAASRKASSGRPGALRELSDSKANTRLASGSSILSYELGAPVTDITATPDEAKDINFFGPTAASLGAGSDKDHPLVLDDLEDQYDALDSPIPTKLLTPGDFVKSKKEGKAAKGDGRDKHDKDSRKGVRRQLNESDSDTSTSNTDVLYKMASRSIDAEAIQRGRGSERDVPSSIRRKKKSSKKGNREAKRKRSSQVSPLSPAFNRDGHNKDGDDDKLAVNTSIGGGGSGLSLGGADGNDERGMSSDDSVLREASPSKKKMVHAGCRDDLGMGIGLDLDSGMELGTRARGSGSGRGGVEIGVSGGEIVHGLLSGEIKYGIGNADDDGDDESDDDDDDDGDASSEDEVDSTA